MTKRIIYFTFGGLLVLLTLVNLVTKASHLNNWQTAYDVGFNVGLFIPAVIGGILIYFGSRIKTLASTSETIPLAEGSAVTPEQGTVSKKISTKKALVILGLVAIAIGAFIQQQRLREAREKEAGNVIKDVLTGSQSASDSRQVILVKAIYDNIKTASLSAIPHDLKLAETDLLRISSYADKAHMVQLESDLNSAITEFQIYQTNYSSIVIAALDDALKQDTSGTEWKKGFREGFLETYENPQMSKLIKNKFDTTISLYQEISELYQFLIVNFDKYDIDYANENSDQLQIYFQDQSELDKFNSFNEEIQKRSVLFQQSQQDLLNYMD